MTTATTARPRKSSKKATSKGTATLPSTGAKTERQTRTAPTPKQGARRRKLVQADLANEPVVIPDTAWKFNLDEAERPAKRRRSTTKIFDPFFTTKDTSRDSLGLGLSVTKNLVTVMGGSIHAKGRSGQGTNFTIRLPSAPSAN